MAENITISGLEDCLRWMDKAPENCMKATRNAMRAAGKKTATKIRRGMPKRWRRLVKSSVDKNRDGTLSALIGLFNGKQRQGHQNPKGQPVDDWFKAYWANYGTLTQRDPNHNFKEPVKRGSSRRRNDIGQSHQNFFEAASAGYADVFVEEFETALANQEQIFYER